MQDAPELSAPEEGATKVKSDAVSSGFTRQQWGLLLVLAAVYFTHIIDFVIVMPLGDQLRQQLHITPRQFGAIVSAYGIAAMIIGIASSAVVDRFDRKKFLFGPLLVLQLQLFTAASHRTIHSC